MSDPSRSEAAMSMRSGTPKETDRPQELGSDLQSACLALSLALSEQTEVMDRSLSDVDLLGAPGKVWNEGRDRLNGAIKRLQDLTARSATEFGAKLQSFHQIKEVLGEDDSRAVGLAFSLLREAAKFFPKTTSNGCSGFDGSFARPPSRPARRPSILSQPDFGGLLGWSRRSQTLE